MPKKKETTVLLVAPGLQQEFSIAHAERLLDMGPALNGGWHLPENSPYIYDEENGLRVKSNKANPAETR